MIAAPSPRKEREPKMSRRRFAWGWLALGLVGLGLLVWLVVHEAPVGRGKTPARISIKRDRGHATGMSPKLEADPATEPLSAEPSSGKRAASESTNSATVPTMPSALIFQKTRVVSHSPTAGGTARLVAIRDIQPEFVKSPVYVLAKGQSKAFTPRTWLRVVVPFDSATARIGALTFRYKISIGVETFVGVMKHPDIFGDGEHQAAAFLIPSVLEPLIQRQGFDANTSVTVEVTALNGETELARSSFGKQTVAAQRERSGFLRSVETTPFAPLEIDLYELAVP